MQQETTKKHAWNFDIEICVMLFYSENNYHRQTS